MRERGWREAGVTKPSVRIRQDFGADGGVGAGWTRRSVGPDEWCLRRGERL